MVTAPEQAQTYDGSTPLDNAQHELLCHQYLIDFNGQEAGVKAGYSEKTARTQVSRLLLTNVDIQARLAYLRSQPIEGARKTREEVIAEIENLAFSDPTKAISWNRSGITFLHDSDVIPSHVARQIESVTIQEDNSGVKQKIKFHDKKGPLALLAKHHGIGTDVNLTLNGESLPEGIVINFVSVKKESE